MPEPGTNLASDQCGWASPLPVFQAATVDEIVDALGAFVRQAPPEELRSWRRTVPGMQEQCRLVLREQPTATAYAAILEYALPESSRRADAILLIAGNVLVLELKGDGTDDPSYVEQVTDYARRLYWFHAECAEQKVRVHTVLVSYGLPAGRAPSRWHTVTDLANLHRVVRSFDQPQVAQPIPLERFLAPQACQPAPSLVQAVRAFFKEKELPRIKRIDEITDGAMQKLSAEVHDAHRRQRRKLILLSGVPGAGKTYVGLRLAHESFLDDLREPMANGDLPTAPAVFLSGNGPLVDVLQYELRRSGGDGKVFVRGVKDFVKKYSGRRAPAPPHHVLIFDEAQRAWDAERVRAKHRDPTKQSEPAEFIAFAERIPKWCVVLALIGHGQEIHSGEEGGMALWAEAIANSPEDWEVLGPEAHKAVFAEKRRTYRSSERLHLARSVRFHFAAGLSDWAAGLVSDATDPAQLAQQAAALMEQGYQIRVTRDLTAAKEFLWKKYRDRPEARFGLLVSSRDKGLRDLGVASADTKFFRAGPWYADSEDSPSSCRRLNESITEFSAQGLELDHVLLLWGSDFVRLVDRWDNSAAKRYRANSGTKDALQLRRNAYRVLLTRGREGLLICCPEVRSELAETYRFLVEAGCEVLA